MICNQSEKKTFLIYCYFTYTTGYLPNVSPKDRRAEFETFIEGMNSFLKHLKRIRTLFKRKNPGRFITKYDSITSNPIIVAGMQRTQSANDKQIKWLI